jgi:hypothetical protein
MTGPGGEKIDIGVISTSEGVCIDVYHLPDIEGSVAATWFTWNEVTGDPEWEE